MKAHPAADAFPMLAEPELLELARDIQQNGQREAIATYQGEILDGRNRLAACELAGVKPIMREVEPVNGPVAFVVSANLRRRHLDESQRAIVAARLATLRDGQRQVGQLAEVPTQAEAAALLNVGERTLRRAKAVLESGDASLVRDVEAGDLSVSAAAAQLSPFHMTESVEWYTPARYVEAARETLGAIDLDPATCAKAQETVKASKFYTRDDDGLSKQWKGRVWLNPPYGKRADGESSAGTWAKRLGELFDAGKVSAAILCVNAFTDRSWFQPFWRRAICFSSHRVKFYRPVGDRPDSPVHGTAFVYFGREIDRFARAFADIGPVVVRYQARKGRAA